MSFLKKIGYYLSSRLNKKIVKKKEDVQTDSSNNSEAYSDEQNSDECYCNEITEEWTSDEQSNEFDDNQVNQTKETEFFNIIQIFTDGSAQLDGRSGSSCVISNETTGHLVYKLYRLVNFTPSYVCEFAAIYQALAILVSHQVSTSKVTIFTDYESCRLFLTERCEQRSFGRTIKVDLDVIRELIRELEASGNQIHFKWIKRNTNWLNKYADRFAREGTRLKRVNFDSSIILMQD